MNEPASSAPPKSPTPADVKIFFTLVSVFAMAAIGFGAWLAGRVSSERADSAPVTEERRLLDFNLIERSGRAVTRAEFSGQYLVVNFVHTSCSITCYQVNQRMAKIQEQLAGRDDVRLVSISVDPQTDTPPVLTKFAGRFNADPGRWLFLTGPRSAVDALVEGSFHRRPDGAPRSALSAATDRIWLVDATGWVRQRFNGLKATAPEDVLTALDQMRAHASTR